MVKGIEKFKKFFEGFEDCYVVIGGTACEIHEELYAQIPRATKDIDIILRHEYYRFMKPANTEFPYQIELFSRNIGLLDFPEDARITPIPTDDDLSSLSAILMDDDYYSFTIGHSHVEDGVHIANVESLICLKCKAFLEMSERKAQGGQVDGRHIQKHKKDVLRLAAMLAPSDRFEDVPQTLKEDVSQFCDKIKWELPGHDFFKSAGLRNIDGKQIIGQLKSSFQVHTSD